MLVTPNDSYMEYRGPCFPVVAAPARRATRHDDTDELCARIEACLDNRDYTELELPVSGWRRWAYYAAIGAW